MQRMYPDDAALSPSSQQRVTRLHCLFDVQGDSRSAGNRYSVPDSYKVGEVADGQSSVRMYAEYGAGLGKTPAGKKKRSQSLGGGSVGGTTVALEVEETPGVGKKGIQPTTPLPTHLQYRRRGRPGRSGIRTSQSGRRRRFSSFRMICGPR